MSYKVYESGTIKDLVVCRQNSFFDHRGENIEGYNKTEFDKIINQYTSLGKIDFLVDSFSFSKRDVLRGFHGDKQNHKLIHVLMGSVYFCVIDLRENSQTYNKVFTQILNDKNRLMVLVPAGCVNAHLVMSENCVFSYKLSQNYVNIENQLHVRWNDSQYNIKWPISNPILSERDK